MFSYLGMPLIIAHDTKIIATLQALQCFDYMMSQMVSLRSMSFLGRLKPAAS
jgi:hypothetical protein